MPRGLTDQADIQNVVQNACSAFRNQLGVPFDSLDMQDAINAAPDRMAGAWPGHWAAYPGWTTAHPARPSRRRRILVIGLIGAVLLPIASIGTCVASLLRVQSQLTEQATRTVTGCSPQGDDQACREALGPGVEPEFIASVQSVLAAREREYGEFLSMNAYNTCSSAGIDGSFRELRAKVEWRSGVDAVAFQWREVDGGWQLTTLAAAQAVPRLCH